MKMWVNHKTGEVSKICPWRDEEEGEGDTDDSGSFIDVNDPGLYFFSFSRFTLYSLSFSRHPYGFIIFREFRFDAFSRIQYSFREFTINSLPVTHAFFD